MGYPRKSDCNISNILRNNQLFLSGFSGFNALTRDRAFTREFLDSLHGKLLFGTDNTGPGLQEFLNGLGIEKEKLENIFYRNATAIAGR